MDTLCNGTVNHLGLGKGLLTRSVCHMQAISRTREDVSLLFIIKERRWFSLGFPAPVIHLVQDIWGGSHSSKQAAQNGMRNILESVFLFERSTKKTNNFDSFVVWQKTNA